MSEKNGGDFKFQRMAFTGDVGVETPLERYEKGEIEDLAEVAFFVGDETDLLVFDYLEGRKKSFTFLFEDSGEFTKLDIRNAKNIDCFYDSIQRTGLSYTYSEVPWVTGSGFDRLTDSIRKADYEAGSYLEDIQDFQDFYQQKLG